MKRIKLLDDRQRLMLDVMAKDRFLPEQKMQNHLKEWHQQYVHAKPFRHIVLDNFFDTDIAGSLNDEFPSIGEQKKWQEFRRGTEWLKNATGDDSHIPFFTRHFLYALNSRTFLAWLEKLTGISGLIADSEFTGGGFHSTLPGGKLDLHADFNIHLRNGLDRRLNLIMFLNKNWPESYGGHLELWDKDLALPPQKILPVFNRVVIFGTTDFTFHGHPLELTCPADRYRKSLALYYYSNGRPDHEKSGEQHLTLFKERPAID
ncbi:2OG-Fe(II) oxygenase [Gilvimarinus sp. 1_MG-2023]|uniref:2OG-Fe(II) oxygenase n=1 Tax=Gilvimarinus sp. 1_MG-2023 TaxID=3062638 RepID=UPI0026E14041|nr:2OG-Fe(II) oxygenase [Gilvimarinus sp. 1_MG-2023]MDO6746807.1 2OG-Fe(II) oxygenase [Gilvimarinus sp. 1_MG-2023]